MFWYFFGGVIAIAILGAIIGIVRERARRKAIRALAAELGLAYLEDPDDALEGELSLLPLFQSGRSRIARNAMHGPIADIEMRVFDYSYATGSGEDSTRHSHTVTAFCAPGVNVPAFDLARDSTPGFLRALFGTSDINFDEFPEFSKRMRLRAEDEAAIRALFDADLAVGMNQADSLSVEAAGEWVIVYAKERRKPAEIPQLVEQGFELATMIFNRAAMLEV